MKTNADITPSDWMTTRNYDVANELKLSDSVQQNINEIMKTINQSINNFSEISDNTTTATTTNNNNNNNNNNKETQDMYIEYDYFNNEINFKPEQLIILK